jgi:hypothetical protein
MKNILSKKPRKISARRRYASEQPPLAAALSESQCAAAGRILLKKVALPLF